METTENTKITVETTVNAGVDKVWKYFNEPNHITKWAFASDDWEAPRSENDLRVGGAFKTVMAAKDKSFSFEFGGIYNTVETNKLIEYTMGDGRTVKIVFSGDSSTTTVTETFDAETTHPIDMQKAGWQAILENFKKHTEAN